MKAPFLYRAALALQKKSPLTMRYHLRSLPERQIAAFKELLEKHRTRGGVLLVLDADKIKDYYSFGMMRHETQAQDPLSFRLASMSKMISAACAQKLHEDGSIDLDQDLDPFLPYSLRHPKAPNKPISLRLLLSHSAGIHDGKAYGASLLSPADAGALLRMDSHSLHLPGEGFEYSNFGFGLVACALEGMLLKPFETIVQETLFKPLKLDASFYPNRVKAPLADAQRILPRQNKPNYDAKSRQDAAPFSDIIDLERHYQFSQGACHMEVKSFARFFQSLMKPGFLASNSLESMRSPLIPFGKRDPALSQGLGIFRLTDPSITSKALYGHQGMAYGAVHMAFFDPESLTALILMTVGASESRQNVLADLNRALLSSWQKG